MSENENKGSGLMIIIGFVLVSIAIIFYISSINMVYVTGGNIEANVSNIVSTNTTTAIDASTNAAIFVNYEHHEIHSGSHYFVRNFTTLANGGSINFCLNVSTGAKQPHILFSLESTGETTIEIYEDPMFVNDGITVNTFNNDRNSANTAGMLIQQDCTISDAGNMIATESFGIADNPNKALVGMARSDDEIILKNESYYIISIDSNSNANIVSWVINWYEHTPKG